MRDAQVCQTRVSHLSSLLWDRYNAIFTDTPEAVPCGPADLVEQVIDDRVCDRCATENDNISVNCVDPSPLLSCSVVARMEKGIAPIAAKFNESKLLRYEGEDLCYLCPVYLLLGSPSLDEYK